MGRTIGAVVAGVVLWGLLWNGGNAVLLATMPDVVAPGQPIGHVGVLVGLIVYSVVVSLVAGVAAAVIKGEGGMTAVKALAGVNLAIGIVVEVMYWSLMPAWYHVIFLALVVPATMIGGRWKAGTA